MNSVSKISFNDLFSQLEKDKKDFKQIQRIVVSYLKENLPLLEMLPQITSRIKDPLSLYKKLFKKNLKYEDAHDILGIRVICHFPSEVEKVNKFIEENFLVVNFEKKIDKLKFDQLGYLSDHFEVKINTELSEFEELKSVASLIFEIQVRTLCQHTWADIEHALLYKQDMELEQSLKRKVFRLTSLLEICDQEFEDVNQKIISHPDYTTFAVLKKLEGKFFKYAKRDYDKESSINFLFAISTLLQNLDELFLNLNSFFNDNEKKIVQIFQERKSELERNIYFSQPEIFLIWFLIETNKYSLTKIWSEYYPVEELEELSIWWGMPIMC